MAELLIIGYNYIYLPHSKCSFAAVSRLMYTRSYTSYTATDADMLKKNLNRGFPLCMKQAHHDLMVKPVFYKHSAHIFLFFHLLLCFCLIALLAQNGLFNKAVASRASYLPPHSVSLQRGNVIWKHFKSQIPANPLHKSTDCWSFPVTHNTLCLYNSFSQLPTSPIWPEFDPNKVSQQRERFKESCYIATRHLSACLSNHGKCSFSFPL